MNRFNWDASLYDSNHSFVSRYGTELLDLMALKKGEKILDVGCGTGDLAHEIFMRDTEVTAIDASDSMVQQAKLKYPHIDFHTAQAETFTFDHKFDGVICNSVLHWIKDLEKPLTNIFKILNKGGRFVAETGGVGNVTTISDGLENAIKIAGYTFKKVNYPWNFTSIGELTYLMEKIGFRVKYASLFERPTILEGEKGLRNWIIMFGEPFFKDVPESGREKVLNITEELLKEKLFKDGQWWADYVRLRVLAEKISE